MLDIPNFESFWIKKSNVQLNVKVSAFLRVFRRQLDLLRKLIEIFTMLVASVGS